MSTSAQFTQWWKETHATDSSAALMWESWQAPHRAGAIVALHCLPPITSLYEVGCGAGPNLRLLRTVYPELKLGGSEPSDEMAAWASEKLGIPIDRSALPDVVTKEPWDAILSCYTMAYLEPADVKKSLSRLYAAGHKSLILMEPMTHSDGPTGLCQRGQCLPEWVHDYYKLLKHTGWDVTWRWPLLPPVDALNAVLIAERMED